MGTSEQGTQLSEGGLRSSRHFSGVHLNVPKHSAADQFHAGHRAAVPQLRSEAGGDCLRRETPKGARCNAGATVNKLEE